MKHFLLLQSPMILILLVFQEIGVGRETPHCNIIPSFLLLPIMPSTLSSLDLKHAVIAHFWTELQQRQYLKKNYPIITRTICLGFFYD